MIKLNDNGVPVAEMPQQWNLVVQEFDSVMLPMEDGNWVKAEDMRALVNQFNLLAQLANTMIPKR